MGRIYLQAGLLDQALQQFAQVSFDKTALRTTVDMNAALMASAEGDWGQATTILERLVAEDPNNFAVSALSFGVFLLVYKVS